MPLSVSVSALRAAKIGGTSVGTYGCLSVTELDSHANMAVAGGDCTIIARSGHFANVTPFSADLPVMEQVEIGDVAIAYNDPYSSRTYLLVMRNALLIPSMDHNLLPPFLVREASLFLDETPKFQSTELSRNNHTIFDDETGMRIHLQLNGTFSYFPTRSLTLDEQLNWDDYPVVYLTPDSTQWDPHATHYADAEAAMIDNCGDIVDRSTTRKILFDEADIATMYAEPSTWDAYEEAMKATMKHDDYQFSQRPLLDDDDEDRLYHDGIRAQLAGLVANEPTLFEASITNRATISHLSMALGSTTIDDSACEVFESRTYNELLSMADVSAISAGRSQGVTPEHIAKIWRIPFDDAVKTLEATTQLIKKNPESSLSRNADTNDRAVRYRRLDSTFFTDTMFATTKAKSLRGNTCAQVFFSDKDYMTVIPMKKESEYPLALKQFAKEVGVPNVLVCDGSKTQNQRDVKTFLTQIGTTLKTLEAETQWANRSELGIGLIKESTRKDLRESGCPIVLWDYCMERRALIYNVTSKKLFQLHIQSTHCHFWDSSRHFQLLSFWMV